MHNSLENILNYSSISLILEEENAEKLSEYIKDESFFQFYDPKRQKSFFRILTANILLIFMLLVSILTLNFLLKKKY